MIKKGKGCIMENMKDYMCWVIPDNKDSEIFKPYEYMSMHQAMLLQAIFAIRCRILIDANKPIPLGYYQNWN